MSIDKMDGSIRGPKRDSTGEHKLQENGLEDEPDFSDPSDYMDEISEEDEQQEKLEATLSEYLRKREERKKEKSKKSKSSTQLWLQSLATDLDLLNDKDRMEVKLEIHKLIFEKKFGNK